jgi:hypothetical protein
MDHTTTTTLLIYLQTLSLPQIGHFSGLIPAQILSLAIQHMHLVSLVKSASNLVILENCATEDIIQTQSGNLIPGFKLTMLRLSLMLNQLLKLQSPLHLPLTCQICPGCLILGLITM